MMMLTLLAAILVGFSRWAQTSGALRRWIVRRRKARIAAVDADEVDRFIAWFNQTHHTIFLHVLTHRALSAHLAQFLSTSPLTTWDPIRETFEDRIRMFDPAMPFRSVQPFRHTVEQRLIDQGYYEAYLEITLPPLPGQPPRPGNRRRGAGA